MVISSPATTRVSLFASAISLPAFTAAMVGRNPAKPTIAVNTISISGWVTKFITSSIPAKTLMLLFFNASFTCKYFDSSQITTYFGSNLNACSISNSALAFAVSKNILNNKLFSLITSSACVPTLPVDPNIAMFFTLVFNVFVLNFK